MTKKQHDVSVVWKSDRNVWLVDENGDKLVSASSESDDQSVALMTAFRHLARERDESYDVGGVRIDPDGNVTISVPVATLTGGTSVAKVKV